jgi:hypothetical protein
VPSDAERILYLIGSRTRDLPETWNLLRVPRGLLARGSVRRRSGVLGRVPA